MINKTSFLAYCAAAAITAQMMPIHAIADETTIVDGFGTIEIVQEGPSKDALGNWTLIQPDNSRVETVKKESYIRADTPTGRYTLLIELPEGTSIQLTKYVNGEIVETSKTPQTSIEISDGDTVRIQTIFSYTRVGNVGVSSDPPGIAFEMLGPNNSKFEGVTPESYEGVPEGMYSVTYETIEGCGETKAQSDRLLQDGRIGFDIVLRCEALEERLARETEKSLTHVTLTIRGETVTFDDVPMEEWFATHVHNVIRTGVMSGYKDERGDHTGQFGPGHFVTIAQLVKVAHELAGIDEQKVRGTLNNKNAEGTWFEKYYLSAEQQSWHVFRDHWQDPARLASRAEVIVTFMQALDVPRVWPKGIMFRDVDPFTPYGASIETAATDGIVSADTGAFRPNDPINRAELAKILNLSIQTYIEDSE